MTLKHKSLTCFIPCCKGKNGPGGIIKPMQKLSTEDLPNTWYNLINGRKMMSAHIDIDSSSGSAINIYSGKFYRPLQKHKNEIIQLLQFNNIRIIVISAGYGVLDLLEPIHKYDAKMIGAIATLWKNNGLENVIADLLLKEEASRVYGFFAGEGNWYQSSSKYRYFFTKGVKRALEKGLNPKSVGCFYRIEGGGYPGYSELTSLGKTFIELMKTGFDESYIKNIQNSNKYYDDVIIGFDKIMAK